MVDGYDRLVLLELLVVGVLHVVHGCVCLFDVVGGVGLLDVVRLGSLVVHDGCLVKHRGGFMVHWLLVMRNFCAMVHSWSLVMSLSRVKRDSVVQDWRFQVRVLMMDRCLVVHGCLMVDDWRFVVHWSGGMVRGCRVMHWGLMMDRGFVVRCS